MYPESVFSAFFPAQACAAAHAAHLSAARKGPGKPLALEVAAADGAAHGFAGLLDAMLAKQSRPNPWSFTTAAWPGSHSQGVSLITAIPRLILLMVVAHTSFGGARLALTMQAIRLDASPATVGLLLSLLMIVPCIASVHVGKWADARGFRPPTFLGLALLAGGGLLAASWTDIPGLAVASVLIGTGYMVAHVTVNNAIGNCAGPEARLRVFGWMAVGFATSGTAGPVITGVVIDLFGFSAAFSIMAAIALIAAVILWPVRVRARSLVAAAQGTEHRSLLRQPELRAVLTVSVMVSLGWDLFNFLVPVHGARLGLSATAIGLVVGSFGAGSFAARIALPFVTGKSSEWVLIGRALCATAVGFAILPFCTSTASMVPLGIALGVALGCGQPLVMCLVYLAVPLSRAGEAVGLRVAVTSVSQAVMPAMLGALGGAFGAIAVFWTAAAVLGSGSVYSLRRKVTAPNEAKSGRKQLGRHVSPRPSKRAR